MKTLKFIEVAKKIANTGLINVSPKGAHDKHILGGRCMGGTDSKNTFLWRKYGTLENIVIFKTADEANEILMIHGIVDFKARPTKSRTMCRLVEVK